MKIWNFCNLRFDLRLRQRGHLRQCFTMGRVVQLAHLLSPTLSLRLARNAYAGKTSRSALLLAFHLHLTDKPLNSLTLAIQVALDRSGLTHDSIELTKSLMIRIAAFDWYLPI